MIIDAHGHLQAPPELFAYAANLLNQRGGQGRGSAGISDEKLEAACQENLRLMDGVGTDVRFTSPRPYLMHAEKPAKIVEWWVQTSAPCPRSPARARGIASRSWNAASSVAGLPAVPSTPTRAKATI